MEEVELISREEKEFIEFYCNKIKSLQHDDNNSIVYTRIPITYAIINKLFSPSIIFHPISLAYKAKEEALSLSLVEIKQAIEEIIVHELTSKEPSLERKELDKLIKHFRKA